MMRMSEQQWDMVINVNLKSAFNFIHACTPIMMRQKAGSIINMASVVGVHGNAGQANYSASKAGMIALAKSIAQELGSRGIRANAIAPGFIMTAMTDALSEEVKADGARRFLCVVAVHPKTWQTLLPSWLLTCLRTCPVR